MGRYGPPGSRTHSARDIPSQWGVESGKLAGYNQHVDEGDHKTRRGNICRGQASCTEEQKKRSSRVCHMTDA